MSHGGRSPDVGSGGEGHRVRYFGWMHPATKMRRMKIATLPAVPIIVAAAAAEEPKWHLRCPHCEAFALVLEGTLPRHARAPPTLTHSPPPVCAR